MSDYRRCKTCGNFGWVGTHKCPPAWECWGDGGDRECAITVYATEAASAAVAYCEQADSDNDYSIIRSGRGEVWVAQSGADGEPQRFDIEAETVPSYWVRQS